MSETQFQVGFGKALTMFEPDWRNKLTPEEVNKYRHFYHQAVQDMNLMAQVQQQQLASQSQQHYQAIMQTIVVVGNEEQIAKAHAEAQAQAAAAAEGGEVETGTQAEVKPAAKVAKRAPKQPAKPAAKVAKKGKK